MKELETIPPFYESELWVIKNTLKERYNQTVDIDTGEGEIRLHPDHRELTLCPVVAWKVDKVTFVIVKSGLERYRCQFFYRVHQQFGTSIDEYDNIGDCVVSLLRAQADYEGKQTLKK
jgi:hypothetical protein